jgi:hypothetical protein
VGFSVGRPLYRGRVRERESGLTVLLHLLEELDNDLGGRADKDLPLSTLLSVGHSLKAVGEYTHANHIGLFTGKRNEGKGEVLAGMVVGNVLVENLFYG